MKKFDEAGNVIKRDAYGFGESYDKKYKCRDRYHICCRSELCNKHDRAPCPPQGKQYPFCHIFLSKKRILSCFIAKVVEKKGVKACYQCQGPDECRSERLGAGSIRTSSAFGGSNLYCYTVCRNQKYFFLLFH